MINMLRVLRDWKFERFPSEIEQEISDDDDDDDDDDDSCLGACCAKSFIYILTYSSLG